MCINPSRSLNPNLAEDHYPLPTVDDLLVEVGGHKFYSLIDLTGAFQQLRLTKSASKLVTIATPFGFYEFLRLPFGIKTANAIFQRVIDQILKDFPWAKAYIDDIIIVAESEDQMVERLNLLFKKLVEFNVKINLEKCIFLSPTINYLGHILSVKGVEPSPKRIQEIMEAQPPKNLKKLQSFLGIMSYIRKFIPKLSMILKPLLRLLKKEVKYTWGAEENESFKTAKLAVKESKFLIH